MEIRKRDLKLSDHNISKEKYNELRYFCLQYWSKKQEIEKLYGTSGASSDGMPRASGCGNPTEKAALRLIQLKGDIQMIEQTAIEADPNLYTWILKSVTEGIPYENMDVPAGRRQFYEARRYFFCLLAQKH